MDSIVVTGNGALNGQIPIAGAKNACLTLMPATLLSDEPLTLTNAPRLSDIGTLTQLLESLGSEVTSMADGKVLALSSHDINNHVAHYDIVRKMRASILVLGPLLARTGQAVVSLPGGCAIGARPVDLHLKAFEAMGAELDLKEGYVHARAPKGLQGAKVTFPFVSVGATENALMAASLARGTTNLENAAREPEVVDLANFCISMGAKIEGAGSSKIVINGVPKLHSTDYNVIPDRIEAGTFLLAGAITRSDLILSPVMPEHLMPVIAKLEEIGVPVIEEGRNSLRIKPAEILKATDIETLPHPGFPTDMQAPFMSLLAVAEGDSIINETVFENRLRHASELNRLGADIRVKGNSAFVRGVSELSGAPVEGTDLRAAAAMVVAALAASGETVIKGLNYLDRGYDRLDLKLQKLGARIERVEDTEAQAPATEPKSSETNGTASVSG